MPVDKHVREASANISDITTDLKQTLLDNSDENILNEDNLDFVDEDKYQDIDDDGFPPGFPLKITLVYIFLVAGIPSFFSSWSNNIDALVWSSSWGLTPYIANISGSCSTIITFFVTLLFGQVLVRSLSICGYKIINVNLYILVAGICSLIPNILYIMPQKPYEAYYIISAVTGALLSFQSVLYATIKYTLVKDPLHISKFDSMEQVYTGLCNLFGSIIASHKYDNSTLHKYQQFLWQHRSP